MRRLRVVREVVGAALIGMAFSMSVFAQASGPSLALDPTMGISTIALWNGTPPGSTPGSTPDTTDAPTLTWFAPQPGKANGTAVVIAPGGAYVGLASNLEGRQIADWFTARGVTAFVLKYRLGAKNEYPIPLMDAQRAIRTVRANAVRFAASPNRIGMVGFSAGGHLTAMAATTRGDADPASADPVERVSARPDFMVLAYAWLNAMQPNDRNLITYCSVLGNVPLQDCKAFEQKYTPAMHVSSDTPPAFLYATTDDHTVPISASVEFYQALVAANVAAELHIFRHGDHGSGLGSGDAAMDMWPMLLEQWMRDEGWLTADPTVEAAQKAVSGAPARKPGEHLSTNSRIADIQKEPAAVAIVNAICGKDFLSKFRGDAAGEVSLTLVAPYFSSQLSSINLKEIDRRLAELPVP